MLGVNGKQFPFHFCSGKVKQCSEFGVKQYLSNIVVFPLSSACKLPTSILPSWGHMYPLWILSLGASNQWTIACAHPSTFVWKEHGCDPTQDPPDIVFFWAILVHSERNKKQTKRKWQSDVHFPTSEWILEIRLLPSSASNTGQSKQEKQLGKDIWETVSQGASERMIIQKSFCS